MKGQGHAVIRCAAGVGMQVDMTAQVSTFYSSHPVPPYLEYNLYTQVREVSGVPATTDSVIDGQR